MWGLILRILIFDILATFAVAKMEINIEGKDGWAKHLPTAVYRTPLTKLIWGAQGITAYHLWLAASVLVFIHLPFFVFPSIWSIPLEALTISSFFFSVALEDFFWFVLNPNFGIKRFNKNHIPWFDKWLGPIPYFYIRALVTALSLFLVFVFLNTQNF